MSILNRKRNALNVIKHRKANHTSSVKTYGRIYLYLLIKTQSIHPLHREQVRKWYREGYYCEDE